MSDAELDLFERHTGRATAPVVPFNEAYLVCGRRAGKSAVLALVAVYLATFKNYSPYLAPGERGTIAIIAADRKQARVIFRYLASLLRDIPMLAQLIERETAESFDLTNRVTIEVSTASYRTARGYTFIAILADELAFWRSDDSANPDTEVLAAVRPGMSTILGAILLCASSPYARRGALWEAYRRYHGDDNARVLVWQDTRDEPDGVAADDRRGDGARPGCG
jgi:type II secretory pathway component GspD/PulD (secretin)